MCVARNYMSNPEDIIVDIGQTLLCSCAISLLLEISTIKSLIIETVKEGCHDIIAMVSGDYKKYADRLTLQENTQLRLQLYTSILNKAGSTFDTSALSESALKEFEDKILDSLLNGITCKSITREIQIVPNGSDESPEFKVRVTEEYKLEINANIDSIHLKPHRFKFISKKQNDSFTLTSLTVNDKSYKDLKRLTSKIQMSDTSFPTTFGTQTFVYLTEITIPCDNLSCCNDISYTITYEYSNYEQCTYLTSSLLYLTANLEENYSIEGAHSNNYIIHGFTHYPYHDSSNNNIYFKRNNLMSIRTSFNNNWQLPGSGSSVVVRKKTNDSEDTYKL